MIARIIAGLPYIYHGFYYMKSHISFNPPQEAGPAMPKRFVDDYLLYLLARASAQVSGQFHAHLRPYGLQVAEWRLLATLSDSDGMTVGELVDIVMFQQPTLTKIIIRMEKNGWLARTRGADDRRKVLVRITDKGRGAGFLDRT